MRTIPLTQGKEALVDDCYYDALVAMGSWYYDARGRVAVHAATKQYMPRIVCALAGDDPTSRVLPLDGNRLNCQIDNLPATIETRVWSRVARRGPDECWLWTGRTTGGYGHISIFGKECLVHRLIYQYATGRDPGDLGVLHTCDNPSCCNPSHLWLGTRADNNRDRADKKRSADVRGERSPSAKLTEAAVRYILKSQETGATLARRFNVCPSLPSKIRHRRLWKHVS
jgi:hypothetical protein